MRQAGIFFFFLGFICLLTQSGAAAESCFGPAAFKPYALLRSLQAARDCYEKVALDANNTIQNIQSLLGTMRNYYAFYNYAVDAPDSTPANNPENWVIYNGTENGQVDLRLKEEELVAQVQQNGANLLTLLDLATVINSPRDMHISSVLSFLNNAVIQNYINIVDMEEFEQIKNGTSLPGRYLTLSESDGVVSVVIKSSETEQVVKVIDTVDGVDALEYLKTFVSMAGLSINNIPSYKALGSRMQSFLQQAGLKNTAPIIAGFPSIGSAINNLPDSVQVEYSDGSSTVWQFLFYPGKDANGQEFVDYSVDELIAYANAEPENSPYTLFNDALLQASEVRSISDNPKASAQRQQWESTQDIASIDTETNTPLNWTFFKKDDGSILFALAAVGDATVLKFQGFSLDMSRSPVPDVEELCSYMFEFSEKNNSTKLLIDLTDNLGGNVDQTFAMAQCLYPQATYEDLYLPYTLRWSDYLAEKSRITSNARGLNNFILSDQDNVFDVSQLLSNNIDAALLMLQRMRNDLKAMLALQISGNLEDKIQTLTFMIDDVKKTKHFRSSFVRRLLQMPDFSTSFRGPSQIGGFSLNGNFEMDTVVQGGIETDIFTGWTLLKPEYFVQGQTAFRRLKNPFKSYAIIGNGLGGSSSALLEMNLVQISMMNPSWTPATSWTYGCVGEKQTCPVNQFQGGYIGGASQYNTMLYGDIGILVFLRDFYATILALGGPEIPSDIFETVTEFVDATDKYIPTVPEPPIGATNGFYGWTFTVYSVMSRITGFKSIPMEYFEVPPTHYIPFWPDWAKAGFGPNQYNSTELAQIYTQVSNGV